MEYLTVKEAEERIRKALPKDSGWRVEGRKGLKEGMEVRVSFTCYGVVNKKSEVFLVEEIDDLVELLQEAVKQEVSKIDQPVYAFEVGRREWRAGEEWIVQTVDRANGAVTLQQIKKALS